MFAAKGWTVEFAKPAEAGGGAQAGCGAAGGPGFEARDVAGLDRDYLDGLGWGRVSAKNLDPTLRLRCSIGSNT